MALEQIFDSASSVMTVISFTTFVGILLWTFALKRNNDFDTQAALPFADDAADAAFATGEKRNG
jgi:cytochrome c oxidase cbb3-type subunit 4